MTTHSGIINSDENKQLELILDKDNSVNLQDFFETVKNKRKDNESIYQTLKRSLLNHMQIELLSELGEIDKKEYYQLESLTKKFSNFFTYQKEHRDGKLNWKGSLITTGILTGAVAVLGFFFGTGFAISSGGGSENIHYLWDFSLYSSLITFPATAIISNSVHYFEKKSIAKTLINFKEDFSKYETTMNKIGERISPENIHLSEDKASDLYVRFGANTIKNLTEIKNKCSYISECGSKKFSITPKEKEWIKKYHVNQSDRDRT